MESDVGVRAEALFESLLNFACAVVGDRERQVAIHADMKFDGDTVAYAASA